ELADVADPPDHRAVDRRADLAVVERDACEVALRARDVEAGLRALERGLRRRTAPAQILDPLELARGVGVLGLRERELRARLVALEPRHQIALGHVLVLGDPHLDDLALRLARERDLAVRLQVAGRREQRRRRADVAPGDRHECYLGWRAPHAP